MASAVSGTLLAAASLHSSALSARREILSATRGSEVASISDRINPEQDDRSEGLEPASPTRVAPFARMVGHAIPPRSPPVTLASMSKEPGGDDAWHRYT